MRQGKSKKDWERSRSPLPHAEKHRPVAPWTPLGSREMQAGVRRGCKRLNREGSVSPFTKAERWKSRSKSKMKVSPLGFILFGTLWVSWTWVAISFPILGKFSAIISSSSFSWPFFLSSSSGTPMIWMLGLFKLSQRSLRMSSFF